MIDIPLYQLEHARRELERLIRRACDGRERGDFEVRDHDTLVVAMDDLIEAKRRENDAHRVTVATGGNREAFL